MNEKEFLEEYVPSDCREEANKKLKSLLEDSFNKGYNFAKDTFNL